ncbi:MAG: glutamate-5-semialdehyde dehydrogenase [Bacteroidota bacterium]
MNTTIKNAILASMIELVASHRDELLKANQQDLKEYDGGDQAMYDRLKIDESKIEGMIRSIQQVMEKPDPIHVQRSAFQHPNGMAIYNRTAPFGTILIIYESRPDVTIEAAVLAFKAGNRILLKGGKEAHRSNEALVQLWKKALAQHQQSADWIQYLRFNRTETQAFLKAPTQAIDLIVPRGGERLIDFVKTHAKVPVLVSGRGNNFGYFHQAADWKKGQAIVLNAKTSKISACNAMDKVLIDAQHPELEQQLPTLLAALQHAGVQVQVGPHLQQKFPDLDFPEIPDEAIWAEEFLAMKIVVELVETSNSAIDFINRYSGGHSVSIVTEDKAVATDFMERIDAAAVYHNASTRFTDGGEFGMGAELAISTDKLHHRGPLGLEQLVTNKWYIYGDGQIR